MSVDVACVGHPFLDLIFRGLDGIPEPGEERVARDLMVVPGAMANVAYALGRLGLDAVVCAPIGRDPAGRLLLELMTEAGIRWMGSDTTATAVSVAMPVHGDRAFVTVAPAPVVDAGTLLILEPRAIVVDLPSIGRLPKLANPAAVYAVVGDPEVAALRGVVPPEIAGARALILNRRELAGLVGGSDEAAAASIASHGITVVVTCGADGAFAVEPGEAAVWAEAPAVAIDDTTGAGDMLTAAFIWADLRGLGLEDRMAFAVRYASHSLAARPARQKGLTLAELETQIGRSPTLGSGGIGQEATP